MVSTLQIYTHIYTLVLLAHLLQHFAMMYGFEDIHSSFLHLTSTRTQEQRWATSFPYDSTCRFEVQLPRWPNRVHIYENRESKMGYILPLRLDRLGFGKNCKRRLGYNYKVLLREARKARRRTPLVVWPEHAVELFHVSR